MKAPSNLPPERLNQWRSGILPEVAFWTRWFRTRGSQWPDEYARRLDPDAPLDPLIDGFLTDIRGRVPRVLDVGCGPVTKLGYRSRHHPAVEVVACDPLAEIYADLRRRFAVGAPVEPVPAYAEDLVSVFGASSFDLVSCENALDHACDPVAGLLQMLRVVRVGGSVVLRHWRNEGEGASYTGFHQSNFDLDGPDFVVWDRNGRINVTAAIPVACDIEAGRDGDLICCRFVKRAEFDGG